MVDVYAGQNALIQIPNIYLITNKATFISKNILVLRYLLYHLISEIPPHRL